MVSSDGPRSAATTYFRQTNPIFMAAVLYGLVYHGWIVFVPETFPYGLLGPIGTFTKYLVDNYMIYVDFTYAIVWLIHISEAVYCLKLCRDKGITDVSTQVKWAVQTFFFGLASIYLLLMYNPQKEEDAKEGPGQKKKGN